MVFKKGVTEPTDKQNVFKISFEYGKRRFCIGRPPKYGIITGCPFGYPCVDYSPMDTASVGGGVCHKCPNFVEMNVKEKYIICNRNIPNEEIPKKFEDDFFKKYGRHVFHR